MTSGPRQTSDLDLDPRGAAAAGAAGRDPVSRLPAAGNIDQQHLAIVFHPATPARALAPTAFFLAALQEHAPEAWEVAPKPLPRPAVSRPARTSPPAIRKKTQDPDGRKLARFPVRCERS